MFNLLPGQEFDVLAMQLSSGASATVQALLQWKPTPLSGARGNVALDTVALPGFSTSPGVCSITALGNLACDDPGGEFGSWLDADAMQRRMAESQPAFSAIARQGRIVQMSGDFDGSVGGFCFLTETNSVNCVGKSGAPYTQNWNSGACSQPGGWLYQIQPANYMRVSPRCAELTALGELQGSGPNPLTVSSFARDCASLATPKIVKVEAGALAACALLETGKLRCWGDPAVLGVAGPWTIPTSSGTCDGTMPAKPPAGGELFTMAGYGLVQQALEEVWSGTAATIIDVSIKGRTVCVVNALFQTKCFGVFPAELHAGCAGYESWTTIGDAVSGTNPRVVPANAACVVNTAHSVVQATAGNIPRLITEDGTMLTWNHDQSNHPRLSGLPNSFCNGNAVAALPVGVNCTVEGGGGEFQRAGHQVVQVSSTSEFYAKICVLFENGEAACWTRTDSLSANPSGQFPLLYPSTLNIMNHTSFDAPGQTWQNSLLVQPIQAKTAAGNLYSMTMQRLSLVTSKVLCAVMQNGLQYCTATVGGVLSPPGLVGGYSGSAWQSNAFVRTAAPCWLDHNARTITYCTELWDGLMSNASSPGFRLTFAQTDVVAIDSAVLQNVDTMPIAELWLKGSSVGFLGAGSVEATIKVVGFRDGLPSSISQVSCKFVSSLADRVRFPYANTDDNPLACVPENQNVALYSAVLHSSGEVVHTQNSPPAGTTAMSFGQSALYLPLNGTAPDYTLKVSILTHPTLTLPVSLSVQIPARCESSLSGPRLTLCVLGQVPGSQQYRPDMKVLTVDYQCQPTKFVESMQMLVYATETVGAPEVLASTMSTGCTSVTDDQCCRIPLVGYRTHRPRIVSAVNYDNATEPVPRENGELLVTGQYFMPGPAQMLGAGVLPGQNWRLRMQAMYESGEYIGLGDGKQPFDDQCENFEVLSDTTAKCVSTEAWIRPDLHAHMAMTIRLPNEDDSLAGILSAGYTNVSITYGYPAITQDAAGSQAIPAMGGTFLLYYGENLAEGGLGLNPQVTINGQPCASTIPLGYENVGCISPPGIGTDVPIVFTGYKELGPLVRNVSYVPPVWTPPPDATTLPSSGGTLTLRGTGLGLAQYAPYTIDFIWGQRNEFWANGSVTSAQADSIVVSVPSIPALSASVRLTIGGVNLGEHRVPVQAPAVSQVIPALANIGDTLDVVVMGQNLVSDASQVANLTLHVANAVCTSPQLSISGAQQNLTCTGLTFTAPGSGEATAAVRAAMWDDVQVWADASMFVLNVTSTISSVSNSEWHSPGEVTVRGMALCARLTDCGSVIKFVGPQEQTHDCAVSGLSDSGDAVRCVLAAAPMQPGQWRLSQFNMLHDGVWENVALAGTTTYMQVNGPSFTAANPQFVQVGAGSSAGSFDIVLSANNFPASALGTIVELSWAGASCVGSNIFVNGTSAASVVGCTGASRAAIASALGSRDTLSQVVNVKLHTAVDVDLTGPSMQAWGAPVFSSARPSVAAPDSTIVIQGSRLGVSQEDLLDITVGDVPCAGTVWVSTGMVLCTVPQESAMPVVVPYYGLNASQLQGSDGLRLPVHAFIRGGHVVSAGVFSYQQDASPSALAPSAPVAFRPPGSSTTIKVIWRHETDQDPGLIIDTATSVTVRVMYHGQPATSSQASSNYTLGGDNGGLALAVEKLDKERLVVEQNVNYQVLTDLSVYKDSIPPAQLGQAGTWYSADVEVAQAGVLRVRVSMRNAAPEPGRWSTLSAPVYEACVEGQYLATHLLDGVDLARAADAWRPALQGTGPSPSGLYESWIIPSVAFSVPAGTAHLDGQWQGVVCKACPAGAVCAGSTWEQMVPVHGYQRLPWSLPGIELAACQLSSACRGWDSARAAALPSLAAAEENLQTTAAGNATDTAASRRTQAITAGFGSVAEVSAAAVSGRVLHPLMIAWLAQLQVRVLGNASVSAGTGATPSAAASTSAAIGVWQRTTGEPIASYARSGTFSASSAPVPAANAAVDFSAAGIDATCSPSHVGLLCSRCAVGYSQDTDGTCKECATDQGSLIVLVLGLLWQVALFVYLVWSALRTVKTSVAGVKVSVVSGAQKIVLTHFQQVGLASNFAANWPALLLQFFNTVQVTSMMSDLVAKPDCFIGRDNSSSMYHARVIVILSLPIVALSVVSLAWAAYALCGPRHAALPTSEPAQPLGMDSLHGPAHALGPVQASDERAPADVPRGAEDSHGDAVNMSLAWTAASRKSRAWTGWFVSVSVAAFLFHMSVTEAALSMFACVQLGDDPAAPYLLVDDVSIRCDDPTHARLRLWLAVPALVVYALGIPLAAGLSLYRVRHRLTEPVIAARASFLTAGYKPSAWWGEAIASARKVVLACVSVLASTIGVAPQLVLAATFMAAALLVSMQKRPYGSPLLNNLEVASLFITIVTLQGGVLMYHDVHPALVVVVIVLVVGLNSGFVLAALRTAGKDALEKTKAWLRARNAVAAGGMGAFAAGGAMALRSNTSGSGSSPRKPVKQGGYAKALGANVDHEPLCLLDDAQVEAPGNATDADAEVHRMPRFGTESDLESV